MLPRVSVGPQTVKTDRLKRRANANGCGDRGRTRDDFGISRGAAQLSGEEPMVSGLRRDACLPDARSHAERTDASWTSLN